MTETETNTKSSRDAELKAEQTACVELLGSAMLIVRNKKAQFVGKLFIPESSSEKLNIGPVIAVGPDCTIPVGTMVEFGGWAGIGGLELFDENHLVIDQKDVILIHHFMKDCWCKGGGKDHKFLDIRVDEKDDAN